MPTWTVAHQVPLFMGILQARILEWVAVPSSMGSQISYLNYFLWKIIFWEFSFLKVSLSFWEREEMPGRVPELLWAPGHSEGHGSSIEATGVGQAALGFWRPCVTACPPRLWALQGPESCDKRHGAPFFPPPQRWVRRRGSCH